MTFWADARLGHYSKHSEINLYRLTALLIFFVINTASAAPSSQCYTGYAYHPEDNTLAFTARYTPVGTDENLLKKWRVVYRDPTDQVLATKTLDFTYSEFVPVYSRHFKNSKNMAGIERNASGNWSMVKREGAEGEVEKKAFDLTPKMASDNGIHPFIQAHFSELMANERVNFELVLPARQRVMSMRIDRIEDSTVNGKPAVRFRAKVDMLFVGWFTQQLVFTYNPENQRLISYRGISNLQDERGKPYPVEVRYYQGDAPDSMPVLPKCDSALPDTVQAG